MSQPDRDTELRRQLVAALEGGHTHMSFAEATRGFPASAINARLRGVPYSFWHLVEHLRLTQRDMLDYMTSPTYEEPTFPEGYWPGRNARATPAQWRRSVAQFEADLQAIAALVGDRTRDLFAPVPNSGGQHTVYRCVLIIVDHNAYHIGELGIGRQTARLWPKGRKG
jgi:DinB superfamily